MLGRYSALQTYEDTRLGYLRGRALLVRSCGQSASIDVAGPDLLPARIQRECCRGLWHPLRATGDTDREWQVATYVVFPIGSVRFTGQRHSTPQCITGAFR